MKEIDDILDEMRKHAGPKQLPHYRRLITGFVYRLEPLIRQLEADRDNWRRQALDEDARANAINSAANTNVDAKVYSKSEMIESVVKAATQAVQLTNEKFARLVGNTAQMREVLRKIYLIAITNINECACNDSDKIICKLADEALSAPPRNCDVGTEAVQSKRYEEYCKSHSTNGRCIKCPLWQMRLLGINCAIAWTNLPSDALEDNKEIENEAS